METNPNGLGRAPSGPRASIWTREAPARRTTLTRNEIVRAAIAVADADGLEGVSLRRVADDLGTKPTSLYTYMDSKDDLLALMADAVVAECLIAKPLPDDWREAILEIAGLERAAVLRHPWVIRLSYHGDLTDGPNGRRHFNQTLAAIAGLKANRDTQLQVVEAIASYVTGFVQREIGRMQVHDDLASPETDTRAAHVTRGYPATLDAAGPPGRQTSPRENMADTANTTLEQGLHWLLAGISPSG